MQIIDQIIQEGAINMSAAAKALTVSLRAARPVHPGTVGRWINVGVTTTRGRRVRLEGFRVGRKWMTSKAAISRFLLAQQPEMTEAVSSIRTPAERQRADAAARRELKAKGAI
jgi:hypothetical protein